MTGQTITQHDFLDSYQLSFWRSYSILPMLWDSLTRECGCLPQYSNILMCYISDRDAKQRWANSVASAGWNLGMGGIGGTIMSGVMKNSVGRVFG